MNQQAKRNLTIGGGIAGGVLVVGGIAYALTHRTTAASTTTTPTTPTIPTGPSLLITQMTISAG